MNLVTLKAAISKENRPTTVHLVNGLSLSGDGSSMHCEVDEDAGVVTFSTPSNLHRFVVAAEDIIALERSL